MIAIIDGCGTNIASVQFALERLGKKSILTTDETIIKSASHVILPGVGTAQYAMTQLKKYQLIDVIRQLQQPVLGICLGMQLFFQRSCEGNTDCLGIFRGDVEPLSVDEELTLPHMGWNRLQMVNTSSVLLEGIPMNSRVYFVHSYAAPVTVDTTAIANYGQVFAAIVERDNFYGVQFHPEKSGEVGAEILKNFVSLSSASR